MTSTTKLLRLGGWMTILLLAVSLLPVMTFNVQAAGTTQPAYGVAVVDGDPGEWNLTADFFADMYRAADSTKMVQSKLYLRYDCLTNNLYVLVLAEPGIDILTLESHTFVKLGNSVKLVSPSDGNDGTPPDFAWIGISPDGNTALGWEASTPLNEGSYTNLNVHTQVYINGGDETSAVKDRGIPLDMICTDYGDLPEGYQATLNSTNGAFHSIGNLRLGNDIDGDPDGQPDIYAHLDDITDRSDEDGVVRFPDEGWSSGATVHITVTVTGGSGRLVGWFDWDGPCSTGDCDFDDNGEMIDFGVVNEGVNILSLEVGKYYVKGTPVFSRFRLYDPEEQNVSLLGSAVNGEVEDYYWDFEQTPVHLASFNASSSVSYPSVWVFLSLLVFGLSLVLVRFLRRMA